MDNHSPTFRSSLGPLLFLTSIFLVNFMSRIILAPSMPTIENDLGLGHGEAGSLFLLTTAGYFITILSAGVFSSRWTHRWTIVISALAVGLALLGISLARSLWGLRLGLLALGMAAGLYLPSGIATLTALVSPRHWGKAIAIHELAPNLGYVAVPLISEALLGWVSWQGVMAILGLGSVLLGVAFGRFGKGGRFPGEALGIGSFKTLLAVPAFWIILLLFALAIGSSLGIYSMLSLYLVVEQGMNRNWANTIIALSRISMVGMAFVGGWAVDRLGPKKTLAGVFLLIGLTTMLLGAAPKAWVVFFVFLQPALAACFFPAGFATLSLVGPPSVRNVAVSLTIPLAFLIGGGAVPIGLGLMGDAGSFGMGITLLGGLVLAGSLLSLCLKLPARS